MNKAELVNKLHEILLPVKCDDCPLGDVCNADEETNSICSELSEKKEEVE